MSEERVQFVLSARDQATATVKRLKGELGAMGGSAATATGPMGKLSAVTGGLISPVGLAIGGVTALGTALLATVPAASDQEEALNKLRVVYGKQSAGLEALAENSARSWGLSETAALGALGTFGNLFVAMDLGQPKAAEMSEGIVGLAADLASFNNIPVDEALIKLRAGLVGETEPLRTLGVNLSAAGVQAKAMSMGLAGSVKALTAADKAQAAYALILEQTTTAQGDFARTADGLANTQRTLGAEFENIAADVGKLLLPVMVDLAKFVRDLIPAMYDLVDAAVMVGKGFEKVLGAATAAAEFRQRILDTIAGTKDDVLQLMDDMGVSYLEAHAALQAADEATAGGHEEAMAAIAAKTTVAFADMSNTAERGAKGIGTAFRDAAPGIGAEVALVADIPRAKMVAQHAAIRAAAYQGAVELAKGLMDGQNEPKVAMDAALQMVEQELTQEQEILRLQGQALTLQTAAGIASKEGKDAAFIAINAALGVVQERLRVVQSDFYRGGYNIGVAWANGLRSSQDWVAFQARQLTIAAKTQMMGYSPPKEGPLKDIDKGGFNIGVAWAMGLGSAARTAITQASSLAGAVNGALVASGAVNYGGAAGGGVPAYGAAPLQIQVVMPDGRVLAEVVTREQYMRGGGSTALPR